MASVLDLIGETPLIEVTRLDRGRCRLFLKLESANPSGAIYINQFANPANPRAHETATGPEIFRQMEGAIDAVVVGVGSGGMLTGIGRFMRSASPATAMVLADPQGSILAPYVETGRMIEPGSWAVEGIGEDFIPPNCDLSLVSKAYSIPDP